MKPGDIVRVKVMEVDKPRKRIALSLRLDDEVGAKPHRPASSRERAAPPVPPPRRPEPPASGALAEAFRAAKNRST